MSQEARAGAQPAPGVPFQNSSWSDIAHIA